MEMSSNIPSTDICPFSEAEDSLDSSLPDGVKKIFIANGFSNKFIISKIDENDIELTEEFARDVLPDLIDANDYPEYYGIFKNNVKKFKVLTGHKKLLLCISNYYKEKYDKKVVQLTPPRTVTNANKKIRLNERENNGKGNGSMSLLKKSHLETVNVDLTMEKVIVQKRINDWIKGNAMDIFNNEELDIKLHIETLNSKNICEDDLLETNRENDIVAKVVCFVCKVSINIWKIASPGHPKRWVFSNYYKHIKIHQGKSTSDASKHLKKKIPLKVQTIDKFINSSKNDSILTTQLTTSLEKYTEITGETTDTLTDIMFSTTSNSQMDFRKCRVIKEADNFCNFTCQTPIRVDTDLTATSSKWTNVKYQRREREKRRREKALLTDRNSQPLITNFFPVLNEVGKLIEQNICLRNLLINNIEVNPGANTTDNKVLDSNTLLKCLYECALNNQTKTKNTNRFDEQLKKFSTYLFIVGGRLLYETLHKNMEHALPSISTLFRYLDNTQNKVAEGNFKFEELRVFLIKRNLPPKIWVSEDATRITGKIEYDHKFNNVIGFVLPLNNGCPQSDSYPATSTKAIVEYFNSGVRANYAYVIMAQSLIDSAPPFCLAIYGTDNRFTYEDIIKRWNVMKTAAADQGIEIIGFSSDGDTRLLKSMQLQSFLPVMREINLFHDTSASIETVETTNDWSWFAVGQSPIKLNDNDYREIYIQDTVHIGTKLRTRVLKPNVVLPMGKYFASIDHLVELTVSHSKDKHLLTMTDIKPEDKMNFRSAEKMCSQKVTDILTQTPGTNATVAYLLVMNYILASFLDKELNVDERIYKIWFSVFFLRIWRTWLKNKKEYTIGNNFITTNCYNCIELNAHSLITLIIRFRDDTHLTSDMFTLWNFSSQTCEHFFRATRSLTSTYSTVVNFSMKDIISRLKRIETINTIKTELKNSSSKITFALEKKNNNVPIIDFSIYTNEKILSVISKSYDHAKLMAENSLGMRISEDPVMQKPLFLSCNKNSKEILNGIEMSELSSDDEDIAITSNTELCSIETGIENSSNELERDTAEDIDNIIVLENCGMGLNLKDFSKQFINNEDSATPVIPINSPFLKITLANKKSMVIKKSSLCWLLEQPRDRVSSDRLRRFINSNYKRNNCLGKSRGKRVKKNDDHKEFSTDSTNSGDDRNTVVYDDDPSSESFDNSESEDLKTIDIKIENYYAVIYDNGWYIGRVININESNCEMKFLKEELGKFKWPKIDDLQVVPTKYIFYGPISLIGSNPFDIKRYDKCEIIKLYNNLK